ncbi:hypothetical protein [Xenorhabdus bovienii]|uniref:hypothetical protein n=1 Tax=Xenorhabdus bovienii TaxID=40576 RepID=UPI003B96EF9F
MVRHDKAAFRFHCLPYRHPAQLSIIKIDLCEATRKINTGYTSNFKEPVKSRHNFHFLPKIPASFFTMATCSAFIAMSCSTACASPPLAEPQPPPAVHLRHDKRPGHRGHVGRLALLLPEKLPGRGRGAGAGEKLPVRAAAGRG